jgi:putative tryptophan/tyrosine transport system substrate-binding protein
VASGTILHPKCDILSVPDVVLGAGEAMRRREFIVCIGSTAAAWPFTARAQQSERVRRIGVLMSVRESDPEARAWIGAFSEGLQQLGWTAGRNIRLDYRWAPPFDAETRQRVGKELVTLQPDLILTQNTVSTASILQESHSIPIIFANVVDPIGSGFVASLARPGGNVTGFTLVESSIVGKWLELLKEIAPRVGRVAFLFNPEAAPYAEYYLAVFKAAAPSLGMVAIAAPIKKTSEIEPVIAEQARDQNGGLFLMPDTFLLVHRAEITSLAARYALPAVYPYSDYTKVGGLVSYGYDLVDNYRRAAIYADRILRGTKPSELPVQLPVKVQLTINVRTAKALGLNVPSSFRLRADEVIE